MKKLSRRSMLAMGVGAAAIPFPVWVKQQAWAQTPRVRYNAESPEGRAMLQKYQAAVNRMMTLGAEGNPTSWVFQWYTHWVKQPPGMASELNRIYPRPNARYRALAEQMWGTCQAHGPNEDEDFFLPWHRMFVYFFELIARQASSEPTFTLPYWNYSNPAQAAMPPEFRVNPSPLYRQSRNPGPNGGSKIPPNQVSLAVLGEVPYGQSGADEGFCASLDFGLHGNVHVWVGNTVGMGSVPWAANDPIFWMHHCNIDRLWASWNRGGRKNPTASSWLDKQFVFADIEGNKVVASVKDFDDIPKLHYTYQEFEPVPAAPRRLIAAQSLSLAAAAPALVAAASPRAARISIPRTGLRLDIAPPQPGPVQKSSTLQSRVEALPEEKSIYLVLEDVRADAPVGAHYGVYIDLPKTAKPTPESPNYVGTINFFGVTMIGAEMGAMTPRNFSFDITDKLKSLQSRNQISTAPTVALVPEDEPSENGNPTIGQIKIIEQ